ncbi:hypothetical protein [Aquimarina sp. RZ0]|uniref:hypothetical protein n=1 Tax=Aquimarina sp. RZ0 TaxID=2607730 RepID=UPI0011F1DF5D|nr:hypothetical protein [Aquimarina sp. RZ0]KAA1242921.1 hypothetical protein F0000_23385 [Aquimarina sp. RZ0]
MKPYHIDFYKVLGISNTATNKQIQEGYQHAVSHYQSLKTIDTKITIRFFDQVMKILISARHTLMLTEIKTPYLLAYAKNHGGLLPQGITSNGNTYERELYLQQLID